MYEKFCVPDLKLIATELKKQRPDCLLTMFAKDTRLEPFDDSAYDVVGVSWKDSIASARKACPSKVLQGNLDPVVLFADGDAIEKRVKQMLVEFGNDGRHIVNLGHGMMPDHKPEALGRFIKTVKDEVL